MYRWITAGLAAFLTMVAYLRTPLGKPGVHDLCSYLSLGLPLLGFVALQERPTISGGSTPYGEADRLQPADREEAAALLRRIAAESPLMPKPVAELPSAPHRLSPFEFVLSMVIAPRRAFEEITRRFCPELVATTLIVLLLQPLVMGNPTVSYSFNFLFLSVFFLLYALGRACLLMLASRWLAAQISLPFASQAVLVNEMIGMFVFGVMLMIPSVQGMSGSMPYLRLGLGEWIAPLALTYPALFAYLSQLHVFTLWGFGLWWVGLVTLTGVGYQKAFVVALLSFVAMYVYVCPLRHLVEALVVW